MNKKSNYAKTIWLGALLNIVFAVYAPAIRSFEISSPCAVLMEQSTGKILFEKNSHDVKYAASLMKIMTLLLSIEAIASNKISEKDMVTVSDNAASAEGADVWLKSGENISVEDLIKSVGIASANDASKVLAEYISGNEGKFISLSNQRATELGMRETIFKDCVGSDEDGNVTSAYDIAIMSRELMNHKKIIPYVSTWIDHIRNGQTQIVNTNKLIKTCQGTLGIKTGTSDKAKSCISSACQRGGMTLIGVILGCENPKERFKEMENLLEYGFSEYTMVRPSVPENMMENVEVKSGMMGEVGVNTLIDSEILVPKSRQNSIKSEIKINEEIVAPIKEGDVLGKVVYKIGDETISEYDILSDTDVEEISFKAVFKKMFLEFIRM